MTVRAGRLRDRVTILRLDETRDEFGSLNQTLVTVGVFWCETLNTKNMLVGDDSRQSQNTIQLRTRYNQSLTNQPTNKMFAEFNGRDYEIDSVLNPRMLNESLVITCTLRGE